MVIIQFESRFCVKVFVSVADAGLLLSHWLRGVNKSSSLSFHGYRPIRGNTIQEKDNSINLDLN